jgi:hypothetical protein
MIEVGRINAKSGLHLRKKPETSSEILATLPYDTAVNIEGREGNWLRVTYNFKAGYLYKDYVTASKIPDLDPLDPGPPYVLPMGGRIIALLVLALMVIWAIAAWVF